MSFIKYEQKDAIAVLTIDRERALNALNSEVLGELDAAIDAIDLDVVRCLIITGAGQKSFVAGADIGEMSTLSKAEGEAFGKKGNDVFRKIEKLPIPVIAAVNGFALGGGCELSMPGFRERCVRPARDRSGHYSRLRRHPAPGPHHSGRQGQGNAVRRHEDQGG